MSIKMAREIDFEEVPRCPAVGCDVGILPYGREEPLVVDQEGRVWCREHGDQIEPGYSAKLEQYREKRAATRQAALDRLADLKAAEERDSSP